MPSPNDDSRLHGILKNLESEYISSGLSRYGAHKRIASEYSVSPITVYCWLTPKRHQRKLELSRSDEYKKKKRDWARKPENRAKLTQYQRIRRNLPAVIEDLFLESGASTMSLEGISVRLKQKTSFKIGRDKILEAIARYNFENDDTQMEEIEPELYRLKI